MIQYEQIRRRHLSGVVGLCEAEGWSAWTGDAEVTWQALTAPGVYTVVAHEDDKALGFAQILSDGRIQAFLSVILVHRDHRRQGIGRQLVREAFARSGARRVDLLTDTYEEFYQSFRHEQFAGYRIYPEP